MPSHFPSEHLRCGVMYIIQTGAAKKEVRPKLYATAIGCCDRSQTMGSGYPSLYLVRCVNIVTLSKTGQPADKCIHGMHLARISFNQHAFLIYIYMCISSSNFPQPELAS